MTMIKLTIWIVFVIVMISVNDGGILLYETEDSDFVEHYDCIYYTSKGEIIPYCRRPGNGTLKLQRIFSMCQNDGQRWNFSELIDQGITPRQILLWSSCIEMADNYARIFNNDSKCDECFLCNCTKANTFGKFCEYELTHNATSFETAINAQFKQKEENQWGIQQFGKILCYQTLKCQYGLLCLDWRNICDGEQQCIDGLDEENCDKLEFNECEDDQYRCVNGMCIDQDFWLDGEPDCMDWTDEKLDDTLDEKCAYIFSVNNECDEHLCSRHFWSCGDGQCIPWKSRFPFQTFLPPNENCYNLRNLNYICEVSLTHRLWTQSNGRCTNQINYNDTFKNNLLEDKKCIYLIRCALSQGLEIDCPCNHNNCSQMMKKVCNKDEYQYPQGNLIRPYISTHYQWNRTWNNKTPDKFLINGSIKCSGYRVSTIKPFEINYSRRSVRFNHFDYLMCSYEDVERDYQSILKYDKLCWNNSKTFNGRLYPYYNVCLESDDCISQYRICDGVPDCSHHNDEEIDGNENLCRKIRNHRFKCFENQHSCLYVQQLGNDDTFCKNKSDEYLYGDGFPLNNIYCRYRGDQNCLLLKHYIENSSFVFNLTSISSVSNLGKNHNHFYLYCDGKWDLEQHIDETPDFCRNWICRKDQYQCQTGQCIELDWLCDGEWDCSDASDEEAFVLITNWTNHNRMINHFNERIIECQKRYSRQPFLNICNISYEYPCFINNVKNPLDIQMNRPCIELKQIGDNIPDCYESLDEKNTLANENGGMIGFTIRCIQYHIKYSIICTTDTCQHSKLCWYKSKNDFCSDIKDVICLDGTCAKNARCNQIYECPFGEDEYWCYKHLNDEENYRGEKTRSNIDHFQLINWTIFPNLSEMSTFIENPTNRKKSITTLFEYNSFNSSAYVCNQGLAVIENNDIKCFCSPAYYGEHCEFFSDRLSIFVHIDLRIGTLLNMSTFNMLKIKANLIFNETIIDHHEFHYNIAFGYIKYKFYFLYSRSIEMLKHKQNRYFNRTDIERNHIYTVHFDIYHLEDNNIFELGSWHYPIYFDFLPVFRIAIILKFPIWFNNITFNPCLNIKCSNNADCKPILNSLNSTYCSCKNGFYGTNCENYESKCNYYCSQKSICKPGGRGQLANTENPFCICPIGYFGSRCNLDYDNCLCLNNGTCIHTYDPSGERSVLCVCIKSFYGDQCQYEKTSIFIRINMSSTSSVSVVQFYDIHPESLELIIQHQQLYVELPKIIRYDHSNLIAPIIGILKKHDWSFDSQYFILYIQPNVSTINISSTPYHCPNSLELLSKSVIPPVFKYHLICQNNQNNFCFHDSNYVCICQIDHYRANCFLHDSQIDHCHFCMSGGKCVKGNLKETNDFICICPHCYYGRFCEFSLHAFGFTIDSLLISSSIVVRSIYIGLICFLFVIGFFTNLCSFVTFKRSRPRKFSIGNYLLIVTFLNEGALLCLLFKFIHILVGFSGIINNSSCKSLSYLLSVFTRSTYWLTSWITIDRMFLIMFPTSTNLKNSRIAIFLCIGTILVVLGMHIHEILFYTATRETTFSSLICVTNYNQQTLAIYNRISTLFHYFVPFFIQFISITLLIIMAARSRARVLRDKTTFGQVLKKLFNAQKELYITPTIIILSALPQAIFSFSLACTQLNDWKRHALLSTYLLSYSPQILGFILFVLPSSEYKKEFSKTLLAKKFFKWKFNSETDRKQITNIEIPFIIKPTNNF